MRVHRSKIDAWFVVVMVIAAVFTLLVTLRTASPGPFTALALGGAAALSAWIALSTRYTLDESFLTVRCGPFCWRIPLQDIHRITPSRNPISSPALSLDRLRIEYGEARSLLISPRHSERFIRELNALRPQASTAKPVSSS